MKRAALACSLLALLLLAASGPAVRLGLPFTAGILALLAAGALGLIGALLSLFSLGKSKAAFVIGLAVAAVPVGAYMKARSVPPINDISTDPKEQSQLQREAYPDIAPLKLPVAPNIAFERAKGAIEESGWQIAREDPSAGRIEAVATSLWFGFKDDVLIRVSADGSGSRVDLRSKSRVGKGDLGTNAQRIRAYQKRLQ
jgi:uncharacterized protein (DUF1499 family)